MTKTEKTLLIIIFLWLSWLTYRTLQEPRWQEMVVGLQADLMAKDDSLDVFKLDHAAIQAQNERTKAWTEMDSIIPDTLDTEGGE